MKLIFNSKLRFNSMHEIRWKTGFFPTRYFNYFQHFSTYFIPQIRWNCLNTLKWNCLNTLKWNCLNTLKWNCLNALKWNCLNTLKWNCLNTLKLIFNSMHEFCWNCMRLISTNLTHLFNKFQQNFNKFWINFNIFSISFKSLPTYFKTCRYVSTHLNSISNLFQRIGTYFNALFIPRPRGFLDAPALALDVLALDVLALDVLALDVLALDVLAFDEGRDGPAGCERESSSGSRSCV